VLSPGNRAKLCKFRYVKWVKNIMWKLCYRKDDREMRPIRGCPENFRDFLTTATATIPKIFHGLLFRSTLWMLLQNLKSVAFPVPEIIGGTQQIWTVSGYAHAPFSLKIFMGCYSDCPCKCTRKIWSPYSFTRSRDNRGYPKIWTVSGYAHAPFSPTFLTGFYSERPCKYIPVSLPVPEIRGGSY